MNTGYVIESKTKSGRTWSYRKEKNGWSQTASTGIFRQCSGDQLLSHLLPPLAGDQPGLSVAVERKKQKQLYADFADSRRLQKRSRKKNLRNLRTTNQIRFHPRNPRLGDSNSLVLRTEISFGSTN